MINTYAIVRNSLNVNSGKITNQPVAEDLGYDYVPAEEVLKSHNKM